MFASSAANVREGCAKTASSFSLVRLPSRFHHLTLHQRSVLTYFLTANARPHHSGMPQNTSCMLRYHTDNHLLESVLPHPQWPYPHRAWCGKRSASGSASSPHHRHSATGGQAARQWGRLIKLFQQVSRTGRKPTDGSPLPSITYRVEIQRCGQCASCWQTIFNITPSLLPVSFQACKEPLGFIGFL